MSKRRYHPPPQISEHPMVKQAFHTLGAMLIATDTKDMEAAFSIEDLAGNSHQFHVEITRVTDDTPND